MSNSGLAYPDGVDPSNNPYINIIENYANVDLQMDVPGYQDFKTKLDLLLASGKLPDIVHSTYPDDMNKAGDQGAFIDLKSYYDKSPVIQKYITPQMMELAKSPSGHYYRIPMAWDKGPQGSGVLVRYDLVQKYNNGKWPESVDEWIAMMRKMHQAEPNSLVMSNRVINTTGLAYGGTPIYSWYGALPYQIRVQDGKVMSTFTLPEYRAATIVMKQLYDEGILDKEFATKDLDGWNQAENYKNTLMEYNTADQLVLFATGVEVAGKEHSEETKDRRYLFAPPLKQYPSVLKDPKYAQAFKSLPITGHGLYIPDSTKDKDRAWKVIEGFASPDLWENVFWGKEGETYTVQNGKKIPDAAKISDPSRAWSLQLAIIFGFTDGQDVKKATVEQYSGTEYSNMIYDSLKPMAEQADRNGIGIMPGYVPSNEAAAQLPETAAFITNATVQAIMGKISMEQFDQSVQDFNRKYGFIYDEQTKYMTEHKDELRNLGVKMVDW
ncbi:extracellular solute-binding protein [Paenibacillus solisilvae]